MKKILYFIPSILIMFFIFGFSTQTGQESGSLSHSIVMFIQSHFHIYLSEFLIRKCAHMSEYALLALSLYYGFYHTIDTFRNQIMITFSFGFIYACIDEFHQTFIQGRAGQFTDVVIDSFGIVVMCTFIYILKRHFR